MMHSTVIYRHHILLGSVCKCTKCYIPVILQGYSVGWLGIRKEKLAPNPNVLRGENCSKSRYLSDSFQA